MSGSPQPATETGSDTTPNGEEDEDMIPEFSYGNPDEHDNLHAEVEPSPSHPASSSKSARKTPQPKKPCLNSIAFPMSRVKRLIKSEGDTRMSLEACYVIAKAVGLFLGKFVEDAFEHMVEDNRTSLSYKDLATHVSCAKRFEFLADFVPEKVTAANALSRKAQEEV